MNRGRSRRNREIAEAAAHGLPWYPWYPGDWLSETRGMPLLARGLYRELLDVQWQRGTLPVSPMELRALVTATATEWRRAWPLVEPLFPRLGAYRQNARLAGLRIRQEALHERRRAGAEQTNHARWGSLSESLSDSASESLNGRSAVPERSAGRVARASESDSPHWQRQYDSTRGGRR